MILDSGCGVGLSSIKLSEKNPNIPVIAIDRSFVRLSKNKYSNYLQSSLPSTTQTQSKSDVDEVKHEDEDEEEQLNYYTSISTESTTTTSTTNIPYKRQSNKTSPKNLYMIRAELADFWYLICHHSDWCIKEHYILYPNPYPKNKHLQRRWHGKCIVIRI